MLHTARCIILFSIFNFEIIVDSQKVVKIVQRVLRVFFFFFFIQFPLTVTCDITGQHQNQDADAGALCLCSSESFYHTGGFM